MIAALDVSYDEASSLGTAAAVVFENWNDPAPASEYVATITKIEAYTPGEFFKRELPCLLTVIDRIKESLEILVVDGYVNLNAKPGLGWHLFEKLNRNAAVIGVAKSRFRDAPAIQILRGQSKSPLYITAVGIDAQDAADHIRQMHGQHRIPTLLKRVDRLTRKDG